VALHGLLTWVTLVPRSSSTTGIKGPIFVVRKLREEPQEESASGDGVDKSEGVPESKDLMDPVNEKVAEEILVAVDSKEKDGVQSLSTTPSPDQTRHSQLGLIIVGLLFFPIGFIALVLGFLYGSLKSVYIASKVSLKYQWVIISGPCHIGTLGKYVAIMLQNFMTWIVFVIISWHISFPVERKIWIVSSLFLLLQPLVLLLVRPQRIRMRIKENIREIIYVLYTFVYVVARLSIPFAALSSARYAM